jgi:GNAT superfamily N-acetyltransferase
MTITNGISFNIVAATAQNLDAILQLQKKAFYGQAIIYNDFGLQALTQTIDDINAEFRHKTFFKLEHDGRIIASIRCYIKDHILFLEKLIVDPDFQNKGIGTKIILEIEKRYSQVAHDFALYTGDKSSRNLHVYRKLGYKEIRQEPTTRGFNLIYMVKRNSFEAI